MSVTLWKVKDQNGSVTTTTEEPNFDTKTQKPVCRPMGNGADGRVCYIEDKTPEELANQKKIAAQIERHEKWKRDNDAKIKRYNREDRAARLKAEEEERAAVVSNAAGAKAKFSCAPDLPKGALSEYKKEKILQIGNKGNKDEGDFVLGAADISLKDMVPSVIGNNLPFNCKGGVEVSGNVKDAVKSVEELTGGAIVASDSEVEIATKINDAAARGNKKTEEVKKNIQKEIKDAKEVVGEKLKNKVIHGSPILP